ncbi:hypothetical protein D480_0228470 [Pseudomonas aeruginosa]|nr:hypothetical protein D480_0228470 [Pseudomonas aeruginosa]
MVRVKISSYVVLFPGSLNRPGYLKAKTQKLLRLKRLLERETVHDVPRAIKKLYFTSPLSSESRWHIRTITRIPGCVVTAIVPGRLDVSLSVIPCRYKTRRLDPFVEIILRGDSILRWVLLVDDIMNRTSESGPSVLNHSQGYSIAMIRFLIANILRDSYLNEPI